MSGNRTPPPSYNEAMRQDLRRKSSYGTADWTSQAGPSWLHRAPAQSQFNTPFNSLQYEADSSGGFGGEAAGCGFVVPVELLGEDPVQLTCPHCHQIVVTEVVERVGCLAYALSALLCLLGCWPCAFLPCCISDLLDVSHFCPNCSRSIHTYKKTRGV